MGTKGLMMEGLAVMTDRAGLDIIGDEGDYAGPIELTLNVHDRLCDTRVASQAVVMMGAADVKSDVLIIWDIE